MPLPFSPSPASRAGFASVRIPALFCLGMVCLALLGGCLFDSRYTVHDAGTQGVKSQDLDKVVGSEVAADTVVELFQPILDPDRYKPGQSSAVEISKPVNVKNQAGRVVRFGLSRQRFGSWSPELEFKWNYFLLQSNFLFFPGGLPDTSGLAEKTKTLYDKIHLEDLFTNYFDSAAAPGIWNKINTSTKPGAIGVMVKLNDAGDTVFIQYVVPESPAGRAGIAKGMVVVAVNDSSVIGDSAIERFQRFSAGDSGSPVKFTVAAPAGAPVDHSLVRMPVAFPTVIIDSIQGVGYLSINGFTPNTLESKSTHTEFKDALNATKRFPVTILDLRDNGGGSLDVALKMCDEILPADTIIIRELQRRFDESMRVPIQSEVINSATAGGVGEKAADGSKRRYLLLGNGHSASASEILLVALKEGAQAPLMGTRTYGKGVGQTVRNTPGKGLALVTFLKFTSASRLDYHKHGLEPDYVDSSGSDLLLTHAAEKAKTMTGPVAKMTAAARRSMQRKAAAVEWNRRQAVRPGVSALEAVPEGAR